MRDNWSSQLCNYTFTLRNKTNSSWFHSSYYLHSWIYFNLRIQHKSQKYSTVNIHMMLIFLLSFISTSCEVCVLWLEPNPAAAEADVCSRYFLICFCFFVYYRLQPLGHLMKFKRSSSCLRPRCRTKVSQVEVFVFLNLWLVHGWTRSRG